MSAFKVTPVTTAHALTTLKMVEIAAEQLRAALAHKDARITELEAETVEWMNCARANQEMLNTIGRQLGGKIPEQLVSEIARQCVDRIAELESLLHKRDRANFILSQTIHNIMVGNQSAWIEWQSGAGADCAMVWINNGLVGPGLIPQADGKTAQEWFDANVDDRMEPTDPRPAGSAT